MKIKPKLTMDAVEMLREECGGVCRACGELAWGGVEPDAHDVECEMCGSASVVGIEDAVICGYVRIVEGEADGA